MYICCEDMRMVISCFLGSMMMPPVPPPPLPDLSLACMSIRTRPSLSA